MDIQQLEQETRAYALKQVAGLLERPDQLEKIDQIKQRLSRKKNSVEAMLKSAMQSQIDDVNQGLQQLNSALGDIKQSRQSLHEIETTLQRVPELSEQLSELRDVSRLQQQYAAAVSTMDFTVTIDKYVERAQKVMDQGHLLAAHKYLIELERTRDRLLMELLRKLGGHSGELERLKTHFSEVDGLSERLGKQLWLKLSRTLTTVRRAPHELVTALRIIEREQQADAELADSGTDYLPPSRPKRWRDKALQVLEEAVVTRIEANSFESREDNKMWLVRHLEVCRQLVLEDLRVVKRHCTVCFPPHYDIFNTYVRMYHTALSKHLMDTVAAGLDGNEYFTLLSWTRNTYAGVELLAHPDFTGSTDHQVSALPPLLDAATTQLLVDEYLHSIESNYSEWLLKAVQQELEDWRRTDTPPDMDGQHWQTTAPLIVFQMVDQNLQVARSISVDFTMRLLCVSLRQITSFSSTYRDAIIAYKTQHFVDRSQIRYFTNYMIAIVNNCEVFVRLASHAVSRYCDATVCDDHDARATLVSLTSTYQTLRDECIDMLLEEVWLDVEPHMKRLLTREWLDAPDNTAAATDSINTICATLEDYCCDYVHLRPACFSRTVRRLAHLVYVGYLTAVLQRRLQLKCGEERRRCADKMLSDVRQLQRTLARFLESSECVDQEQCDSAPQNSCTDAVDVVKSIAEVVAVRDLELLTLEIHGVRRVCPDLSADHLTALLLLRGDLGRLEVRERVNDVFLTATAESSTNTTIMSSVNVPASLFGL